MTLEDLVQIRAIEELKYRYLRFLDLKMFDDLEATLTPDATASYGGGAYSFDDRASIMSFLRANMAREDMLTSHKVHHPEITITGPDTAAGTWALDDKIVDTGYGITITGAAYYEDTYRRVDDAWYISHTGYKRIYEEIQPRPKDLSVTANWWATDGRSTLAAGTGSD